MGKLKMTLVIVVVGFLIGAFLPNDRVKPDAVTAATVVSSKDVQMPKKSKDYKAYQVNGLTKYVVAYSDNFARGGMITTIEGMEALKKRGVKTIVSIVPSDQEKAMAKQFGFKLVDLPFPNEVVKPEDLNVFKKILEQKESIYVHCHGGSHRAGVLGVYYRLWTGWTYERALKEFGDLGGFIIKDKALLDVVKNNEVNHGSK